MSIIIYIYTIGLLPHYTNSQMNNRRPKCIIEWMSIRFIEIDATMINSLWICWIASQGYFQGMILS